MCEKKQNAQLLNFIYRNSQTGENTITKLMDIVTDESFREVLYAQQKEYHQMYSKAAGILKESDLNREILSDLEQVSPYLEINCQSIEEDSASHIAELLIVGSTRGILQTAQNIRKYKENTERNLLELAESLRRAEENNIERLKKWC